MAERTIAKNFNSFSGRDIRSSDLVRSGDFAIEFENTRVVAEDSCVKREGFKIRGDSAYYEGLYTYRYSDLETGETLEEQISMGDGNIYQVVESTFTVDYSGSDSPVHISVSLDVDTETFKCVLMEDGVEVLSFDLGTGLESSPVTLATLRTQINAVTGFSATIDGTTTFPAAFLPTLLYGDLASAPKSQDLVFYEYFKINTLVNLLFGTYHNNRGLDSWELASIANADNCLFIGTGYEYIQVYDGQNVYRAGMPFAETTPTTATTGTGFTDTGVKYIYLYKQVDNRGNEIFGIESDPSVALNPANNSVNVTVANILAADGFNTGCAKVSGAQVAVNIIVVDNTPHTFKVGDTAYFLDRSTGDYVEREITAVGTVFIIVDGDPVNVNDDDIISNNLRIVIYRNTAGGRLYYKVAEIPNNSFSATQVYLDGLAIASLGEQYIPPTKERGLLGVKPRYLCMHQDLLMCAGDPAFPNTWFHSNGEGPWYFGEDVSFEDIRNTSAGGIKGLGSNQEHFAIGTDKSIWVITGDIDAGSARQEKLTERNVGFACHNTIVDIGGPILFLSKTGFWKIENGFNLVELGAPINPIFNTVGLSSAQRPALKRSYAIHFEETQEYLCFVPCESGTGTTKFANEYSSVQAYDTFHQAWSEWSNLNMAGGLTVYQDNLWFQSRRDDVTLTVTGNLWRRNDLGRIEDYADHHEPINFILGSQWLDGGEPSVFKVFLWLKVYNLLKQALSASFTLSVSVERDLKRNVPWFDFELDFGAGNSSIGWGLFPWGLAAWGTPVTKVFKKKLKSGKAESIRFVFSNNILHEKVAITGWETVVTNPYEVMLKN